MSIENPLGPDLRAQEKEAHKKYIEDILDKGDIDDSNFLCLIRVIERCIQVRAAFEIIQKYNADPESTAEQYNLQNSKKLINGIPIGGISVNKDKVLKDMWAPSRLQKDNLRWEESFEILDADEINNIHYNFNSEDKSKEEANFILMNEVLRCRDNEGVSLGKKFDLFLNNSGWRQRAEEYTKFFLHNVNQNKKLIILNTSSKKANNSSQEKSEEYQKTLEYMTEMYLEEMQ